MTFSDTQASFASAPALPVGVTLTPAEQSVLGMMSHTVGVVQQTVKGLFPLSAERILARLVNLGLVTAVPTQTYAGLIVEFFLA